MDQGDGPVRHPTTDVQVIAVRPEHHLVKPDRLATEEPMEIRAAGPGQEAAPVAVTMRTPGHDFELAVGFLLTEGLVADQGAFASVRYCQLGPDEEQQYNIVTVRLNVPWEAGPPRPFAATSSCGVCGKATLDDVVLSCPPIAPSAALPHRLIAELPDRLRAGQQIFDATGGLHAAAVFDRAGEVVCLREDVGRHNAVDKLVGHAALGHQLPLSDHVLMVSGRISFEIVQKAAMAGVPVVGAVSAPSSLAVAAGDRLGVTVIGFVRDSKFNIYSHPERIDLS
jgi:FdhD protein